MDSIQFGKATNDMLVQVFFFKKRGDECHGVLGVFPPKTGSERLLVQFFLFFQKGDECYGGPLLAFPP